MFRPSALSTLFVCTLAVTISSCSGRTPANVGSTSAPTTGHKEGDIIMSQQSLTQEETERMLSERVEIWDQFYTPANQIAEFTKDPLAKEILEFLQENGSISAPHAIGPMFLEPGKSERFFAIVPLKEEDRSIGPKWDDLLNHHSIANFIPEVRMLVTKHHKMTPLWRGLTCLHEGLHAMRVITEQYDHKDHQTFCVKELEAHEFQNRLITIIGEERYVQFVDMEIRRMKQQMDRDGMQVGVHFLPREENYPMLETLFGPNESAVEADFRATSTWIHCLFELIDRYYDGDKQNQKALILKTLYLDSGVLK